MAAKSPQYSLCPSAAQSAARTNPARTVSGLPQRASSSRSPASTASIRLAGNSASLRLRADARPATGVSAVVAQHVVQALLDRVRVGQHFLELQRAIER